MPEPFVQVALDLSASLTTEDRYQRLVNAVKDALGVDGVVLLRRREDDVLVPLAIAGIQPRMMQFELPLDNPAIAGDLVSRAPVRKVGEVGVLSCYAGVPEAEQKLGMLVGVPLVVEDRVVGALNMATREIDALDQLDDQSLLIYAALAAAALHTGQLLQRLEEALALHQQVTRELQRDARQRVEGPLLGSSEAILELKRRMREEAKHSQTLLLAGPPGSPKEAVARAIHAAGPRTEHAFIHVHCATQSPHTILGSGYALIGEGPAPSLGKLDLAAGGTLFVEGVEHIPTDTQLALAKLIERYTALRAAGRPLAPDVRLLVAASMDFEQAVAAGRVVKALAAAVKLDVLRVPGLEERREDIPQLVRHLVRRHALRIDSPVRKVSRQTMRRLVDNDWPGDVEELSNVLGRAVAAARGDVLEIDEGLLRGGISLGSYTLIERIADGGMGEVWLAHHKLLARPAAVKVIRPEMLAGVQVHDNLRRFLREARATANLRSLHTIEIYDFGISEDGAFYYVMERLHGLDLETLVQRFGPLPPERAIRFLRHACRSLSEAHEAGLVHRDVKPANLFAAQFGHDYDMLKVLDFGMVTTEEAPDGQQSVQGTPGYIAPEAALLGGEIDQRADIYALGCVAFWMLTGFHVFERDNALQVLMAHLHEQPEPPSSRLDHPLPDELDELVLACIDKDPARRPADVDVLYERLRAVVVTTPWTQARAKRWWHTHAPEVLSRPAGSSSHPAGSSSNPPDDVVQDSGVRGG